MTNKFRLRHIRCILLLSKLVACILGVWWWLWLLLISVYTVKDLLYDALLELWDENLGQLASINVSQEVIGAYFPRLAFKQNFDDVESCAILHDHIANGVFFKRYAVDESFES